MADPAIWYDSTEAGIPALNNTASSLLAVLDACIVTGFNLQSISSLVVSGGVAIATCNGHGFSGSYGKDILVAGANTAVLNGRKRLSYVDTNTFRFPAPGVPDQTVTGAITAKRAPLGWTKQYTGTNKAVYKRSVVTASAQMLRIVDAATAATDARALMVEAATDVDTYTGPGPTDAQLAGGQYWFKGTNSATAKRWILVGDESFFYLFTDTGSSTGFYRVNLFGDAISYRAGDAYPTLIGGDSAVNGGTAVQASAFAPVNIGQTLAQYGLVVSRLAVQTGGAVRACVHSFGAVANTSDLLGSAGPSYPSPVDNGVVLSRPVLFNEGSAAFGHPIRGIMPGLAVPLAAKPFGEKELVSGFTGDSATYLSVTLHNSGNVLLDLTNPWR